LGGAAMLFASSCLKKSRTAGRAGIADICIPAPVHPKKAVNRMTYRCRLLTGSTDNRSGDSDAVTAGCLLEVN